MKIALDYDKTYDVDPEFWNTVVIAAHRYGHDVRIVTARHEIIDNIDDKVNIPVIYCDGVAKKWFCHHQVEDFEPDVWIDDRPSAILENGSLTKEQLNAWREENKAKSE